MGESIDEDGVKELIIFHYIPEVMAQTGRFNTESADYATCSIREQTASLDIDTDLLDDTWEHAEPTESISTAKDERSQPLDLHQSCTSEGFGGSIMSRVN